MIQDKVLSAIEKFDMLRRGDTVIAAVSGGIDSMALLHILNDLKDHLGIKLHVAHLNHGIRGEAADEDARFVAQKAKELDLLCIVKKVSVPVLKKKWKMGTEEAARKARYEFLDHAADCVGASRIATAHTASDQAETVLMNILRGSGTDGLAGISPVRDRIIRPMIEVFRRDIEGYAKEHNLGFREDATNVEMTYTRNRIRHELLPLLRSYNPRVDDALTRLADTIREDIEIVSDEAILAYDELARYEDDAISFPLARFLSQPKAIQRRLLRLAVESLSGSLVDLGFVHIDNLLARSHEPGTYEVELPSGTTRIRKTPDMIRVYAVIPEKEPIEVRPRFLDIPGQTEIPELNIFVKAEPLEGRGDWRRPRKSMDVVIDSDKVEGNLIVRSWLPGDRVVPLGMTQSKKLQDIFVDHKIPQKERSRIPIVADEEKILWVAGVTISQQAAVTEETESFLKLTVSGEQQNQSPLFLGGG